MIIGNKDERPFDINVNNIKIENSIKILLLKKTLVNFAEEHCTNFILYVESISI